MPVCAICPAPAPDSNLHLLLQNHVIAENRRQSDVSKHSGIEERQSANNERERDNSEDDILHGVSLEKCEGRTWDSVAAGRSLYAILYHATIHSELHASA